MPNKNTLGLIIGIIVIVALIIGWQLYSSNEPQPVTQEPVVQAPPIPVAEPETAEPAETVEEPSVVIEPEDPIIPAPASLENSDPQVRSAVTDFAPKLSKWLLPNEQIRKWVLTVDLLADGKMPKRYLPIDYPMSKFSTDDKSTLASSNYARMDEVIDTVTAMDSSLAARYYNEWLPALEQAYKEQGKTGSFDQRFKQTISQVLATEPLEQAPALKRPGVLYKYADQNLEAASDIEKLMWRMGPENSEKIQNFLRDLRNQIDQNKE
ncbi:MAG: DUF3014 domain-containing protein [Spongiibacteraceae bacterium]